MDKKIKIVLTKLETGLIKDTFREILKNSEEALKQEPHLMDAEVWEEGKKAMIEIINKVMEAEKDAKK